MWFMSGLYGCDGVHEWIVGLWWGSGVDCMVVVGFMSGL